MLTIAGPSRQHSRWRTHGMIGAAGLGLLALLLMVLVGSSQTSRSASHADKAGLLNAAYRLVADGVTTEESEDRQYRLDPGPIPLAAHEAAQVEVLEGLTQVRQLGTAADRGLAETVAREHAQYVAATADMFKAVDGHRSQAVISVIDSGRVDPIYRLMHAQVSTAADVHQTRATAAVDSLQVTSGVIWKLNLASAGGALFLLLLAARQLSRAQRRLQAQSELNRHQAMHDSLTKLPNRALFQDRTAHSLASAKRGGNSTAVLLVDLDRFKEVNDTLGHDYGDLLLWQIAERFRGTVRAGDSVARLGGDEFAVLLPDTDAEQAQRAAERLTECLQAPFDLKDISIDMEASIGIALADSGSDVLSLLRHADVAMYQAKRHHKPFALYEASHDDNTVAGLALLGELRRAVSGGELLLHYQPKVSSTTGALHSVEALVRWQHPKRGMIAPDAFIPLAEGTAVIHPLTSEVLRLALMQARSWLEVGWPIPVCVNISARSLLDVDFPNQVKGMLESTRVPATMLCLELTESAIMSDPERAQSVLQALEAMGVSLSIDDFGTGYSSMSYLKTLPVKELKIDRSFVMGMATDRGDVVLVQSAVDLGHNLGLQVVAEGVEDAETQRVLASMGCDLIQGYHVTRPISAGELDQWLLAHDTLHELRPRQA